MDSNKVKKERSSNFTQGEIDLLMKCIINEIYVIESKKTDAVALKEKQEAWERVIILFNSCNINKNRDVTSLKTKYDNIKRNLKKKITALKIHLKGTGGGPPISDSLTWYEEVLYKILKVNIDGLQAEGDSDAIHGKQETEQEISETEQGSDLPPEIIYVVNDNLVS